MAHQRVSNDEKMNIGTCSTIVWILLTQPPGMGPRDLLSNPRQLTNTEIAAVLDASQRAIAGRTFRLSSNRGGQGTEILMGHAGRPRRIRQAGAIIGGVVGGIASGSSEPSRVSTTWRLGYVTITDYTDLLARHCNGLVDEGDLVLEYRLESSSVFWQITARRRDARDFGGLGLAPAFEMLHGAGMITSGELKRVGNRLARALVAPWAPPGRVVEEAMQIGDPIPNVRGDPLPNETVPSFQSLWIDSRTLLPLRWEVSERGLRSYGFDFTYSSFEIPRPAGVRPPDCIR